MDNSSKTSLVLLRKSQPKLVDLSQNLSVFAEISTKISRKIRISQDPTAPRDGAPPLPELPLLRRGAAARRATARVPAGGHGGAGRAGAVDGEEEERVASKLGLLSWKDAGQRDI